MFEKLGRGGYGFPGSVDVCTENSKLIQGHSTSPDRAWPPCRRAYPLAGLDMVRWDMVWGRKGDRSGR